MTVDMTEKLEAMLASGQDNMLLRFGLGSNYFNHKKYEQAIPHLIACLDHDKTHSPAWKFLGRSYMALGQKDKAKEAFEAGLQVAQVKGDKQVEKEINVFLKKL